MINLDRITSPLRLARGSHEKGSGKGCAMNVISYINGDAKITDYPSCSARPLARLVQGINDCLAEPDGYLSPENAMKVLDLGWQTVGTADAPIEVIHAWLAELLDSPEWGVVRFASINRDVVVKVADLHRRAASGVFVSADEWYAANSDAVDAAYDAAYPATYAAAYAAAAAYPAAAADAAANAAAHAADAYAAAYARYVHGKAAIEAWHRIANNTSPEVDYDSLNSGLMSAQTAKP